jgi:hypothetical protein
MTRKTFQANFERGSPGGKDLAGLRAWLRRRAPVIWSRVSGRDGSSFVLNRGLDVLTVFHSTPVQVPVLTRKFTEIATGLGFKLCHAVNKDSSYSHKILRLFTGDYKNDLISSGSARWR